MKLSSQITICRFALIALLAVFSCGTYAQQSISGNWLLATIESKDSILVHDSNERMSPATSANTEIKDEAMHKVALKDYMKKDLHPGVTKFIFAKDKFEFYRNEKITNSGTYTLKGSILSLFQSATEAKKAKQSKIILLDEKQLILESESNGKPLTLTFTKL